MSTILPVEVSEALTTIAKEIILFAQIDALVYK